jgi:uncharacterized protein YjbI with pentapeptide repeats
MEDSIHFKSGIPSPQQQRCSYCHDAFGGDFVALCSLCQSTLHLECLSELQRCPTLGCPTVFQGPETPGQGPISNRRERRDRFIELRARQLSIAPSLLRRDGSSTNMTLGEHFQEDPIDLSFVDLPGVDLTRFSLNGALFVGSWLAEANFRSVRVSRGDFTRAHLVSADFRSSYAIHSIFQEAKMDDLNMSAANFNHCDFSQASMLGINASGARAEEALWNDVMANRGVFCNAQLQRARFRRAHLEQSDFRGAQLQQTDFRGSVLEGAQFQESVIEQTNFMGCTLLGVNFESVDLTTATFDGAIYDRASIWPKLGLMKRFKPQRKGARLIE